MDTNTLKGSTPRNLVNRVIGEVETRASAGHLRSMPLVVEVVLTKACNLACTFCKDYDNEAPQNGRKRILPTLRRNFSLRHGGYRFVREASRTCIADSSTFCV